MTKNDYILTRKAAGDARDVAAIGAEFDALAASLAPPPPDPATLAAAVTRAADVDAWLLKQRPGDGATPPEIAAWDDLRRLPFEEQAKRAGL